MSPPASQSKSDEILARDLEIANAWIDIGIGMSQRAIRAFARGIEAAYPPGTMPQTANAASLRTVADLLEHLKHTQKPKEAPDDDERPPGGGPQDAKGAG